MDANEYALKVGPAAKSLGVAIRSAQWLGRGTPAAISTTAAISAEIAVPAVVTTELVELSPAMRRESTSAPLLPLAAEEAAKEKTNTGAETAASVESSTMPCAALPMLDAIPAQVVPDAPAVLPAPASQAIGAEQEHVVTFGERRYRVRGLEKNLSLQSLKVNPPLGYPAPTDRSPDRYTRIPLALAYPHTSIIVNRFLSQRLQTAQHSGHQV